MPRRLNIYIFKEIAVPFALSLIILTATALLSKAIKIVELMLSHGVGPSFIFWFVLSVAPSFLIYTIPISFLAAILIAFTRLSSDCEVTAMKASGLSLFTIMRPVMAFSLAVFLIALAFTSYIFPWGNRNLKNLLYEAGQTQLAAVIEEKTFYDRFRGAVLYVDHYNSETGIMEGVFISEEEEGGMSTVFLAPRGIIAPSGGRDSAYIRLYDGAVHRKGKKDDSYHIADFSSYTLELKLKGGAAPTSNSFQRPNRELYPGELAKKIALVRARGESPSPFIIDFHKRFALPASIFIFSLLGVPLGIQRIRTARFTGFSTALVLVLVYYLVSTALEAIGEGGNINPILAVWGSDIIFAVVGCYIFYMAARDKPLGFNALLKRIGVVERRRQARV